MIMKIIFVLSFLLVFVYGKKLFYKPTFGHHEEITGKGKNWVVLVAGSNTYDNYRHQADVCHAYHVVRSKGVPAENIIVMMYDDVANDPMNPHKGRLFNHPHGPDVYEGVPIDYRTTDVTPQNFLAVLRGDVEKMKAIGSGRVVNSTSADYIFLNMVDHGGPGIFCFPDSQLHANDFLNQLTKMYEQRRYAQMVIYLESCESGSMFEGLLPSNINVYATTAANAGESSYACFWDDVISTYLGDVYSVMWMADSEAEDSTLETLHKQFLVVKKDTNTSHVTQYGDQKMAREPVEDFQGSLSSRSFKRLSSSRPAHKALPFAPLNAVPSEDVPLAILYRRLDAIYASSSSSSSSAQTVSSIKLQIRNLIKERDDVESVVKEISGRMAEHTGLQHDHFFTSSSSSSSSSTPLTQHHCYKSLVRAFDQSCFSVSQSGYARKNLRVLLKMCEDGVAEEAALQTIASVCRQYGLKAL